MNHRGDETMAHADLPRLENRVTFLTHRINARLQQVSLPVISPHGMDLYSSRILFALDQNGPMKVGQLVELMALPQSTISHQLKRMEKSGLIRRTRSDQDNRSVEVSQTEAGVEVTRVCTALSDAIAERLNAAFAPGEMQALIDGLNRVFEALGDLPSLEERCEELIAEG
ncbi:MarR family winged helix-turn-helix transcriptional regulator [Pararhodobacter sp.]|uniref:MarR family winged helix-turn-helix transcriptional regulator n=1 Tax=Pararhodobacter sp. TaxID=2127056 RepID=UPI002FDF4A97